MLRIDLATFVGMVPFLKKINNGINLQMSQNVQLKTWEKMATIKKLYKVWNSAHIFHVL